MTKTRWVGVGAALLVAFALAGCGGASTTGDVIAPVTMGANELQGTEIDLLVGQSLNITTGDLAVGSYRGEVSDTSVAEFVPGHDDGSAQFNPGVTALAPGTTTVTMVNDQGGIPPLAFSITVTKRG